MNPLINQQKGKVKKRVTFGFLIMALIMLAVFQFWPQPESSAQSHSPIIERVIKDTMAIHEAKIEYKKTLAKFDSTLAVTVELNQSSKKKD